MAFLQRINQSKLKSVSYMFKRYYFQVPHAFPLSHHSGASVLEKQRCGVDSRPALIFGSVRFFASPVQAKQKKEDLKQDGPRLNEQIRAHTVRLVTDKGNSIVSIREALEHARRLELDLVEVQRNADPPVCKIMDFHEQKYKKQVREKERAKSKSEMTLRKGDCKEVRFTEKIEQKDLQMKADTVVRLMEKGYRVKVMAMGKGKEDEDENLGGVLSRLTDLIESVAVVESGPMLERRQAYVVVRHEKFGPLKKGGGKKSKVSADAAKRTAKSAADNPSGHAHDSLSSEDDSEDPNLNGIDMPISMPLQMKDQNMDKAAWSVLDSSFSGDDFRKVFDIDIEKEGAKLNSADRRTPADPRRAPPFGNSKLPPFDKSNQQPSYPNGQHNRASSFGVFSSSKPSSPSQEGVPLHMHRNSEVNRYASSQNRVSRGTGAGQNFPGSKSDGGWGPDGDKVGRSGFGIFSRESAHGTSDRTFKRN